MVAIINARIIQADHIIPNATLVIDGEKIAAFGKKLSTVGMEIIDAKGAYIGPGLIDIHTHSDGNTFFYDNPAEAAKTVLAHGVTDVLPALYFNTGKDELLAQIKKIKEVKENGEAPNILGLYMEAPYLNPKFGCNRENNPWKNPIKRKDYLPLIKEAGTFAKVWCVAPEREHILDFVLDVKKNNPEAVLSVAHSEAEPGQIEALLPYGLRLATHHTNATGTLYKYPECRSACVDETALYNDCIYTELICDKVGIHVAPYMLRLIKKIKGDDRLILISDAFVEHGPVPADDLYEGADDINFDFSGEIAGSRMILDGPCRNMMVHTGASLCQVFKYASSNPARLLGLSDRGSIAVGNIANLILVDAEFNIQSVFLAGKRVK